MPKFIVQADIHVEYEVEGATPEQAIETADMQFNSGYIIPWVAKEVTDEDNNDQRK